MAPMGPSTTNLKRKQPSSHTPSARPQNNPKRVRTFSARTIISQLSEKALNKNGELDVSSFVKAREYEIRALESSMRASKKALTTRTFQQVPRELRRRTASHNVKRVPKRLRARAAKEMKNDKTPTVTPRSRNSTARKRLQIQHTKRLQGIAAAARAKKKASETEVARGPGSSFAKTATKLPSLPANTLATPPKAPPKFRKRQIHKAWLPTHLYHSKRAHMTPPKEPLWRFAVAMTPTEKSYRITHRASSMRGCVAWDMSYMSTIGLEGVELSLIGLLRSLGVPDRIIIHAEGARWRQGTRSWKGWLRERDGDQRLIAPTQIIWHTGNTLPDAEGVTDGPVKQPKQKRRLLLRVHPSAFLQLWNDLLKVAKMQRPQVTVEDLRFEIGSIEIEGPGATEALVGILHPVEQNHKDPNLNTNFPKIWQCLAAVTNPASLPANALLGFQFLDPRLHHPPRTVVQSKQQDASEYLLQTLAKWPLDSISTSSKFFDRKARLTASRLLPSQKSINRRKGDAQPGAYPAPRSTDPQIPGILLVSRSENGSRGQGSWTLLLPWKCVVPVWYSLMHYPLSTGGNPRFGGIREKRQLAFEHGVPWFPGDFPGTKAGWEWEMSERARRKSEWEKRPKGKRTEWSSVDLGGERKGEAGLGFACDWERLLYGPAEVPVSEESAKQPDQVPPFDIHHITRSDLSSSQGMIPRSALASVGITLIHRGVPTACARIYRLPAEDKALHAQWLALATIKPSKSSRKTTDAALKMSFNNVHHQDRVALAASLIPNGPTPITSKAHPEAGNPDYPIVPGEEDLIGFITTGNFNLGEGRGTGIGCIALAKVQNSAGKSFIKDGLCIIREAGLGIGRIAKWEVV